MLCMCNLAVFFDCAMCSDGDMENLREKEKKKESGVERRVRGVSVRLKDAEKKECKKK